jgi:Family of unknown function (DUF6869)
MMNKELTPKELSEAYLRQLRCEDSASAAESFDAIEIWEDLMCDEPEKAWLVFLELLARPHDDDTLEDIKSWLELLLWYHYDAFHELVKELVRGHDQLPRFLPDEALEKERFEEEEVADDEIVDSYLEHYRHLRKMIRIDQLITKDPDRALPLVLEIIHRGQNYNFESYDLFSPLWDLLRRHGEVIIDRIEREAPSSVMLRRCLWKMKLSQENAPPQYRIAEELWRRVKQAAGGTTDYNSKLPEAVQPNQLSEEDEELLSSWFASKQTKWASGLMWDLTDQNPERSWPIIKALVEAAPDDPTVSYIGAGPVQELLSKHGEQFIERIEQQAAVDAKFRACLTVVSPSWLDEEILQRLTRAIGYQ